VRKLAFNSIVLALGSYIATGASALTYLLAARTLGPTLFGSLSGAIGLAIVVSSFGDFGVNGWTIRALARNPTSLDLFKRTLSAKLAIALLLAVAWVVISLTMLASTSLKLGVALLGAYVLTFVIAGTLTVPFRASERMTIVSVIAAVEKVVALVAWLAMQIHGGIGFEALPIALVIGGVASVVCAAILIPRDLLALNIPSFRVVVDLWRSSFSFGMVGVSTQILRADVAIVSAVSGPFAAGVYAAPARFTAFVTVIPAAFSAAIFPRIARSATTGASRRPEFISAAAMLALMVLILGGFALAAPLVVPLVLGQAYAASVGVLRVILLVALINSANQPLLMLLQAAGLEQYAGRAVMVSAATGLLAIAVGARLGGATGAAIGALLMQLLQLALFAAKALRMPPRSQTSPPMHDSRGEPMASAEGGSDLIGS
jgi:O-antigen/teichoic acid export membrane protein